jgi:hypothetical protein
LARALKSLGYALVAGLSMAALHALFMRIAVGVVSLRAGVAFTVLSVLLGALVSASLRVRREDAARKLDASHDLHDRVRTAVEFSAERERSRFMEAALRDAASKADGLSPARAVVLEPPRFALYALFPLLLWLAIGLWPASPAQVVAKTPPTKARALSNDDLQAFRTELASFAEHTQLTPESEGDVKRYNALLEQLGTGELSRAEALEALLSLEKKLLDAQTAGGELDRAAMRELANDLARADEALSEALFQSDAERAARELERLAQRMAQEKLDENQQKQLREALDKTRARQELSEQREKREQELESLLKKKPPSARDTPAEKSLFERNKRELERLRRERAEEQKRHRQLSRLSRELSDASRALDQGHTGGASQSMSRGAESLRKFGNDNLTREQREDLRRQVEQLREMLQRQGDQGGGAQNQAGQGQDQAQGSAASRAQRFVLRAQGQDPNTQEAQLTMQRPQGRDGQDGQEGQKGQEGQNGQPGQQGKQGGAGGAGNGQGGQQGEQGEKGQNKQQTLVLGGEGPAQGVLEIPNLDGKGGGGSELVETQGASDEHDPRKLRAPSEIDAKHEDSRLAGTPGKGPTRSEVILDAADRGFVTSSYRKVYSDYRSHAEDVLEREEIPPGYRFYVRRYFQLIRPRSSSGSGSSNGRGNE